MSRLVITPTTKEFHLKDGDFIFSKTNKKGIITYCNQIFIELSGYDETELLGTNHNIVRHPSMPKIAFSLAWEMIQAKEEFFGFVKNMRKDGGYYWVFANISADYDNNGQIIGYTSVRRKPKPSAIATIEPIYAELLRAQNSSNPNSASQILQDILNTHQMSYNELILHLQRGA